MEVKCLLASYADSFSKKLDQSLLFSAIRDFFLQILKTRGIVCTVSQSTCWFSDVMGKKMTRDGLFLQCATFNILHSCKNFKIFFVLCFPGVSYIPLHFLMPPWFALMSPTSSSSNSTQSQHTQ